MRFKNQRQTGALPEINLTPMLNVMMGILAFFVMITMMLTTQQGVQVQLPDNPETATPPVSEPPEPLLVQLKTQGISLADQLVTEAQMQQQMQAYLDSNAAGIVVLEVESEVPYEQVIQLLGAMKDIGGDRVSLAIDE